MKYRRITAPGGTFFFTLVNYERRSIFADEGAVEQLRQAFRYVLLKHPFTIQAAVVLPDHLHMLWRLPPGDSDYSLRWRLIKSHFAHRWEEGKPIPSHRITEIEGRAGSLAAPLLGTPDSG